jgi:hypothetical protein
MGGAGGPPRPHQRIARELRLVDNVATGVVQRVESRGFEGVGDEHFHG